jgi:hypothetical protein
MNVLEPPPRPEGALNVLVTGATGFIGRSLVLRLAGAGHRVTALARSPERARQLLGPEVAVAGTDDASLREAVREADAIINLAGESIAGGRWTRARRAALRASRIELTGRLVAALAGRRRLLSALVSASAVGYYGDRGEAELDEHALPGDGFAAELCRDWEAAALAAAPHVEPGRVVRARLGVVLGPEGGALAQLARLFRLGLGGPLGDGRQWLPWIHLDDVIEVLARAAADPRYRGALNLVAPEAVRQRDFARTLAGVLHRPAVLRAPRTALRLARGEAADLLLASQRVVPRALAELGYAFRHATLASALEDLVGEPAAVAIRRLSGEDVPRAAYLTARRPRYALAARTVVDAPLAEVFPFFSAAENLAAITPPALGFRILTPRPIEMSAGAEIEYRISMSGVPMRWTSTIEVWQPGVRFVDSQARGPYRAWWHEHRFRADGPRTIMEDIVYYAPPLGPLGRLANRLFIGGMLRRIFGFRRHAIRARFGGRGAPSSEPRVGSAS